MRTDRRSVGELLQAADLATRRMLEAAPEPDAAPGLRTWGELVQAADELWRALPPLVATPDQAHEEQPPAPPMAQVSAIATRMHHSLVSRRYPGAGSAHDVMADAVGALQRAGDLVSQHPQAVAVARTPVGDDLATSRTWVMTILANATHAVRVNAADEVRRAREHGARSPIPRHEVLSRLDAAEAIALDLPRAEGAAGQQARDHRRAADAGQ